MCNTLQCKTERSVLPQEHEMKNLLVWAIPAQILSEDESSTEVHREHHSRAAGLNQELAAAEKHEWNGLVDGVVRKQQI